MDLHEVKLYHIVYSLSTLITTYLVTLFDFSNLEFLSLIGYLLFLFYVVPLMSFVMYAAFASLLYETTGRSLGGNIGLGDIYLSASVIITAFLVPFLFKLLNDHLFVVILIVPLFFIIYKSNELFDIIGHLY